MTFEHTTKIIYVHVYILANSYPMYFLYITVLFLNDVCFSINEFIKLLMY